MLQPLCNGSVEDLDFSFKVSDESFDFSGWNLPTIVKFVKPVSLPIGDEEALFSIWQETKRKDIDIFLVLKIHFLAWSIPFGFIRDIVEAFDTDVVTHIMMTIPLSQCLREI